MNYLGLYNQIMEKSKNLLQQRKSLATSDCAIPKKWNPHAITIHYIIPRGIWGHSATPENTIYLSRHEQLVAYKLLQRMYPNNSTIAETLQKLTKSRGRKKSKINRHIGRRHSPETRAKMSASHTGKTFSAESRSKMSEAKKGRSFTAEHIANRSASRIRNGRGFKPETIERMRQAAKNRTKKSKWSVSNV